MTPEFNNAYRAGWRAWEDGLERPDNPHRRLGVERAAWLQGWAEREMKAQADARAERAASPLAFPDLCRLSRAFLVTADLRDGQDLRINEWLKNALATHPENT